MSFKMQRVHLFHAEVEDKPGGVSSKLKRLAEAGAHLEYVYSQRSAFMHEEMTGFVWLYLQK